MPYGIKHATVNAAADGDNELVAAVAGRSIIVVSYVLNVGGSAASGALALLRDATAHTERARLTNVATTGIVYSYSGSHRSPAFECGIGEALEVNNAANVDVVGHLSYILR